MTASADDEVSERAVEQLSELGLGLYAARTFVALTVLSGGTAVDVSRTADVPRTRVYDAVEELSERDLVHIDDSTPKQFSPVGGEEAADRFLTEYEMRVNLLRDALTTLEDEREERRSEE